MDISIITKGQRTQQAILDAAYRLFPVQGYHGTSMRQIAREADVALGGIYNHFSGKEELFAAVFSAYHPYREILPALSEAPGEAVEDLVRGAVQRMVVALERRPGFLNLVFIEIVEFEGKHFSQIFDEFFPMLEPTIQRFTQNESDLRAIAIPVLIRAFVGLFFAYAITDRIMSERFPPEFRENALEGLIDIFLHGILTRA